MVENIRVRVRNRKLNGKQLEALDHLKSVAMRKRFYAEFVANLYDGSIKCDVRSCARYIAGEPSGDDRLAVAFDLVLSLAAEGIESHEYLGQEFLEKLISDYSLREGGEQ